MTVASEAISCRLALSQHAELPGFSFRELAVSRELRVAQLAALGCLKKCWSLAWVASCGPAAATPTPRNLSQSAAASTHPTRLDRKSVAPNRTNTFWRRRRQQQRLLLLLLLAPLGASSGCRLAAVWLPICQSAHSRPLPLAFARPTYVARSPSTTVDAAPFVDAIFQVWQRGLVVAPSSNEDGVPSQPRPGRG